MNRFSSLPREDLEAALEESLSVLFSLRNEKCPKECGLQCLYPFIPCDPEEQAEDCWEEFILGRVRVKKMR